jgi:hypothetical protein
METLKLLTRPLAWLGHLLARWATLETNNAAFLRRLKEVLDGRGMR